jgi:hypothetical protein
MQSGAPSRLTDWSRDQGSQGKRVILAWQEYEAWVWEDSAMSLGLIWLSFFSLAGTRLLTVPALEGSSTPPPFCQATAPVFQGISTPAAWSPAGASAPSCQDPAMSPKTSIPHQILISKKWRIFWSRECFSCCSSGVDATAPFFALLSWALRAVINSPTLSNNSGVS